MHVKRIPKIKQLTYDGRPYKITYIIRYWFKIYDIPIKVVIEQDRKYFHLVVNERYNYSIVDIENALLWFARYYIKHFDYKPLVKHKNKIQMRCYLK